MRELSHKSIHREWDRNTKPSLQKKSKCSNWLLSNLVLTSKAVPAADITHKKNLTNTQLAPGYQHCFSANARSTKYYRTNSNLLADL